MSELARENVLIIEAGPGVAALERRRLERAGYGVFTATNVAAALEQLRQHRVHLILLDYRLPGDFDGQSFYAETRKAGHDIPVLQVTGVAGAALVIQALRSGAADFVTKSIKYLDDLPEVVARVLRQVRTEQRLADSEARLASILGSTREAILVAGADGRITLFNAAAEEMFRCSAGAALQQPLQKFLPEVEGVGAPAAGPSSSLVSTEMRGARADGTEFPVEAVVSYGEVAGRKFSALVVRDVTERKCAAAALRESEERFQTFMDNSPAISFIKDEEGRYVYVSNTCERHLGWPATHQLGKTDDELWPPQVAAALREHDRVVLSSGEPLEVEETVATTKGQLTHWLASKFPFADRFGRRFVGGVAIDITAQKRTQEQLRQAQKMDAIGKLAGGVAHDFNNLLTVILGYSELLQRSCTADEQVVEIMREVHKAGERAALLTHKLLAFSRQKALAPRVLDLNQLVVESEKMFRRLLGATIEIHCSLPEGLGRVKADPGGLEQVLLNLVVNAHDAMPNGGLLTLETRNVELNEGYAGLADVRPGSHVLLAVSDTGCGMDDATKGQIFEPFFTTKEAGKGTGLGLSMVHGLVKQSGGHIEVYSELGRGTTFKIYLPRVLDSEAPEAETERALQVPRGSETVLLAEDEDAVRGIARTALLSSGYTVLEARDGAEALTASQQCPGTIDLLVTDVVMPKMSGRQLADQLKARWPGLKVLYMSGYTDDAIVRHGVLEKGMAFLQKPFTPIALARKVREVLDS